MPLPISPLHLRRSILIHATPERVWEEFTSFERLAAWFGTGHTLEAYEPQVGGEIRLSVVIDGTKQPFGGRIVAFDPGAELSFANNWEQDGWPVPTAITLRLTPYSDACLAELFHHGFDRLGADAANELQGYEAGWDNHHLEHLRRIVEG